MKLHELRIKRATLGAEARIIKNAEQRALRKGRKRLVSNKPSEPSYALYSALRDHRVRVVRPAARAGHLAHAYLVGRAYATVENPKTLRTPLTQYHLEAIAKTVRDFGDDLMKVVTPLDILRWVDEASPVQKVGQLRAVG